MFISAGTRDGRGSAAEGKGSDGRGTITELCIPSIQSGGYRATPRAIEATPLRHHSTALLSAINALSILLNISFNNRITTLSRAMMYESLDTL